MKLLLATIFIAYLSSAKADCSTKSWNVVQPFAGGEMLGRWFAVLRFANGKNDTSDCLWHDLSVHPTIPNAIQDIAKRAFKNGEKYEVEGVLTAADPSKNDGLTHVVYNNGEDLFKHITFADYSIFGFMRACVDGEEYFWVYSRNQYPTNSTFIRIYEEIDNQGINRSKLIKSCIDVPASVFD